MTEKNRNAFDKAAAKARNKEAGIVDDSPSEVTAIALPNVDTSTALTQFTPEALAELMASGDFETGEQIIILEQGKMLRGQLIGRGGEVEFVDTRGKTPEVKKVQSWRMRLDSGIRVTFMTSAQLERMLPEFVGRKGTTVIVKGARVETKKGNQMDEFFVAGPKPSAKAYAVELRDGRHVEVG